ncbi:MAG: rod shape-determining protein MreC [Holosporales bacterium]|jgi:cell shape-determining protein MreC|nr:rod shape-determining protein MreC [Holosporales bacterium]
MTAPSKTVPRSTILYKRKQALLKLFLGCVGIGLLRLPCAEFYIQQGRLFVTEMKVICLKAQRIYLPLTNLRRSSSEEQEKTIEELHKKLITAHLQIQQVHALQQENTELRNLLSLRVPQGFKLIGAHVLCQTNTCTHMLLLDVGTDKGVCLNAAVVVRDGLVGSITQVGRTWSRVLLITDGASRIPVSFHPSGEYAVLVGSLSPHLGIDLLRNRRMDTEQTAFTSESGACFPKGILVGSLDPTDSAEYVVPAATTCNLTFVCVLIPLSQEEKPHGNS